MTGVTWLHLSDWHQENEKFKFNRKVVCDSLIKDIKAREEGISPCLKKIDFIVFSGDVAKGGDPDEYKKAKDEFFTPILDACELGPERLFIVPGNHDLNRDQIPVSLSKPLISNEEVERCWSDKRKTALLPFQDFYHSFPDLTGREPGEQCDFGPIEVGGKKISLLCINSAWMCARHKDEGGKVSDQGYLCVGEPQIYESLEKISSSDIRIALLHHPFDWLAPFDKSRMDVHLKRRCNFILHGHAHEPGVSAIRDNFGYHITIPAGACYDRSLPSSSDYTYSYNYVHLDFDSDKGIVFFRKWSELNRNWKKDDETAPPNGERDFSISGSNKPLIPHQIPSPPPDFTGRDDDIEYLLERFGQGTTITGLRGMGGIGKTALAFKLAEKLIDRYPDGQIFVNMNGTSDEPLTAAEAMSQIIHAYETDARLPAIESELSGLYRSKLHSKKVLILLDNAANDDQVRPLLPPSSCGLIVTSREKFTLPGLIEKDLNIMPSPDACALLLKIASRIGDHAEELARLCGYLPLALRAASSLLANELDLSIAEYLKELRNERTRLERIGGEGVELDVEASFNLSYSRLKQDEARVFRLLSIFPAGFDANAEEFLCKDKGHKRLSKLVRWSLVDFYERNNRYRLHDLARIFAAKSLLKEDGEAVRSAAMKRYFVRYLNVLTKAQDLYEKGGNNIILGLEILDRELSNIQAGQAWIEKIAKSNAKAAALCISYAYATSILSLRLHPYNLIHWLEVSLDVARQLNKPDEGAILIGMGNCYVALGEARKAIELYEQGLPIFRKIRDQRNEGIVLCNLGGAYAKMNETRKAIDYYEQALPIARKIGDQECEGVNLANLGSAYDDLGDARKAIEYDDQALAMACKIGDRKCEGDALGNLGLVYADLGDTPKAVEHYEQALAIAREIGYLSCEGRNLVNLGEAYVDLGETRKAIDYYEQALTIAQEIGDKENKAESFCDLGKAYLELKEIDKAINYITQSLDLARNIESRKLEGEALSTLGKAFTSQGDLQRALDHCDQALKIFREIEYPKEEAEAIFAKSQALHQLDRQEEATQCAQQALAIFQRIESHLAEKVSQQLADWGSPPET